MAVEFRVLGTTEVLVDGTAVPVGPARQRAVLAALLADVNQTVPVDQLVDRIWGGRTPYDAVNSLRSYVSRLRRIPGVRIDSRSRGYALLTGPASVDLHRFRTLADAARTAEDEHAALALFEQALGLWRGEPLADLDTPWADTLRSRLDSEWIAVQLDCNDLRLRRGDHTALLAELATQTVERPLDERLAGQFMLALYRCGRQAEALTHFDGLRTRLAGELGIDPMPEIRDLHQRILRADADLRMARPSGVPVPRQLPAAVADFTGRADALKELDAALPARISMITGTAGVGKTALAVEWAHRVVSRFPDGQLYINLRGYGPGSPVRPIEALTQFLRALGVGPEQLPADVDEAAGLLRTMLADRKVLVLLDNAADPDQIRPLLPGSADSLVLVTSRDRLDGLVAYDGARRLTLDVLSEDEASRLLARVLSAERVDQEPEAVAELIRFTARLPLALRIAAAKLAGQPGGIAEYVTRLRSGDQLGNLEISGDERAALRSTFDLSYRALTPDQQRIFRLLGLFPGDDFASGAAAALADVTEAQAAILLDRLAAAHLVNQHRPGRYTFHDLLRRYAAEQARSEDSDTALSRLSGWYLRTADAAARTIHPQLLRLPVPANAETTAEFPSRAEALVWLDSERNNLVAVGLRAAGQGPRPVAWRIADALRGYFWFGGHHLAWSALGAAARTAAQAEGDARAKAVAELNLGDASLCRNDHDLAIQHYTQALDWFKAAGWPEGQGTVFSKLGLVHRESGDASQAADCYRQALSLAARAGSRVREAGSLGNLGFLQYELGEYEQAAAGHAKALAIYREFGIVSGEATAAGNLGDALHALGRFDEAMAQFTRALPMLQEVGDVSTQAATLRSMAAVDLDTGHYERAAERIRTAVELARQAEDGRVEADARNVLGMVHQRLGRTAEAIRCHEQALELAQHTRIRYNAVEALLGLAVAGDDPAPAERALRLARETGYRGLEGRALTVLARLLAAQGEPERAAELGEQALRIHRETGHRPGEAHTLSLLAELGDGS